MSTASSPSDRRRAGATQEMLPPGSSGAPTSRSHRSATSATSAGRRASHSRAASPSHATDGGGELRRDDQVPHRASLPDATPLRDLEGACVRFHRGTHPDRALPAQHRRRRPRRQRRADPRRLRRGRGGGLRPGGVPRARHHRLPARGPGAEAGLRRRQPRRPRQGRRPHGPLRRGGRASSTPTATSTTPPRCAPAARWWAATRSGCCPTTRCSTSSATSRPAPRRSRCSRSPA